ncbi:MAG: CDP-glucose 4,6-dehydratase [Prolixibacteraceae bacterium]|nr:CDP-glucose 4,6-dehydratase [Prolixibacteraceae bacterium]
MLNHTLSVYKDKKVLITGNTGFKGSWMCQWLINLGAEVYGIALDPPTDPSMFKQLKLEKSCKWYNTDIRNFNNVRKVIEEVKPEIIFHLAAQSLIRVSYDIPLETFDTNVMGTVNLFEAIRQTNISTNIIVVTSDKCYENQEWLYGYRENDPLGGYDPYSASKGAVEIIVSSFRRSFFNPNDYEKHGVNVSSARAGNVIGGGDWSLDRIVPDCIRFIQENTPIKVRNPLATRPWQHVLEPLGGYLILGAKLITCDVSELDKYCSAFNFGPAISSNKTVEVLVKEIIKNWGKGELTYLKENAVHEAILLSISIDKAYSLLKWQPVWEFKETIKNTVLWYKEMANNPDKIVELTNNQINQYSAEFRFCDLND